MKMKAMTVAAIVGGFAVMYGVSLLSPHTSIPMEIYAAPASQVPTYMRQTGRIARMRFIATRYQHYKAEHSQANCDDAVAAYNNNKAYYSNAQLAANGLPLVLH